MAWYFQIHLADGRRLLQAAADAEDDARRRLAAVRGALHDARTHGVDFLAVGSRMLAAESVVAVDLVDYGAFRLAS